MNGDKVYCLMVAGPGIDEEVRELLFDTAQAMHRKGSRRFRLRGGNFEGLITTANKTAVIGGVTGTIFNAVIESETSKHVVSYLIRPMDMENYVCLWSDWDPTRPIDPHCN